VSMTGAEYEFGLNGTESEARVVVVEAATATVGLATEVVEAADGVSTVVWSMSPMRVSNQ